MNILGVCSTGERLSHEARVKIGVRHVAARIRRSSSDTRHLILTEDGQALGRELARLAREVERLGGLESDFDNESEQMRWQ